ncbi:hypothetical protein B1759_12780 [Rubrivirga sp. SAORIC476]|uniref:ATP-binding protein n=1 Tax=Rubrivirga sp. SAORIC476 TaxID=1961794 RepID=UPI000BA8ED84|nr:ATP-binding protein [Rubrivirga sp. SAORIC476]PAP79220.1 hypothetical protein B1759_12780 [Rubrivirga sp. SAORIC476]
MQRLHLRALRVSVSAQDGLFGTEITFERGLNIIRADNSRGKSTILNSILYALGLEILSGRKGPESMKPALRDHFSSDGEDHQVLESFVELEISNQFDAVATIRRQIVGDSDSRLVLVTLAQGLTGANTSVSTPSRPYYLHDPGAAQRELGFHTFLARFLNLELPKVATYRGSESILYLECLASLMFIEQVRGWSAIQATTPTAFGIQNVKKAATEYLLDLDIRDVERLKKEVEIEKDQVRSEWKTMRAAVEYLARQSGGVVANLSEVPIVEFNDELDFIFIPTPSGEEWVSLQDHMQVIRSEHEEIQVAVQGDIAYASSEQTMLAEKLHQLETRLLFSEAALDAERSDLFSEEASLSQLEQQIESIESDIVRNADAIKLKSYGASVDDLISLDECPTCHQGIANVLLEQGDGVSPMTIEENIQFLKQQRVAALVVLDKSRTATEARRAIVATHQVRVNELRVSIRDLKSQLTAGVDLPDLSLLRKLVQLDETIRHLEQVYEETLSLSVKASGLSNDWREILVRENALPRFLFSDEDEAKLAHFTESFRDNIINFEFGSDDPMSIDISRDSYRPTKDDFEMIYDASASDNIRIIWAYTIAMLETSIQFSTNHWGILFFDEPAQQQVSDGSRDSFYSKLSGLESSDYQCIVTTSESRDYFESSLADREYSLTDFDSFIIDRM